MRLTHLTLKNWRNFKQADFDLQERVFVIGPNASGKSNLLDALRFLRQVASPGGGFQDAVANRGGMARVRCLAARNFNHGHVTLGIVIGDDQHLSRWSYQVTFTAEQRGRHRPILRSEVVERNGETVLRRPTDEDTDDPERMTQTHLEQVNANREFREIVDYLGSIRYLHLVPQLIREPDRGGDRSDDPYGADFLLRMAKTPENPHPTAASNRPIVEGGRAPVGSARSDSGRDRALASASTLRALAAYTGSANRAGLLGRHATPDRPAVVSAGGQEGCRTGAPGGAGVIFAHFRGTAASDNPEPGSQFRRSAGPADDARQRRIDVARLSEKDFISLLRWIKLRVVWIIQRRSLFWRLLPEHHMRVYLSG